MLPFIDLNYTQIWGSTTYYVKYLICIFFISVAKLTKYKDVCAHPIQNEYILFAKTFFKKLLIFHIKIQVMCKTLMQILFKLHAQKFKNND